MSRTVIECPSCNAKLRFPNNRMRTAITCPRCTQRIVVSSYTARNDEPLDIEPQEEFAEPTPPKRQPRSGEKPRSIHNAFDYFGVGDEKPTRSEDRTTTSKPTIQNRRERRQAEGTGAGKALVVTAILVPLIGIAAGAFYFLRNGDEQAGPVEQQRPRVAALPKEPAPSDEGQPPVAENGPTREAMPPANTQASRQNSSPKTASEAPPTVAKNEPRSLEDGKPTPPIAQTPAATTPRPQQAAVGAKQPANQLQYKWKAGDEHVYALTVVATQGGVRQTIKGSCSYKVRDSGQANTAESKSSGTGFVVSADGYIATCAHVVEDAKNIDVRIDGKDFRGRVIAQNRKLDLAIVKIDARNLQPLALGDSDKVQLAERVRAFGFPLSSMLGTGLKVASGEVAGTVDHPKHGRQIQTDAPINPGNSGGPMINDSGQVIGIASSKIRSSVASSVGFAVPINELKKMLVDNGIAVPPEGPGNKLDGPTLAKQVSPGVAYVKVRSSSAGKVFDVQYTASYSQSGRADPRNFRVGMPGFPTAQRSEGKMKVNVHGNIVEFSGGGGLPFVLGPIAQIFIEPVDEHGDRAWGGESDGALNVVRKENNSPFAGMPGFGGFSRRGGFGPPGFPGSPFGGQPQEKTLRTIPAREVVSYKLGDELNNRVSIHKTYQFITADDDKRPYLTVEGKGEIVFDKTLGMPTNFDYTATMTQNDEDGRTEIPLTVNFVLRDPEQIAREREEQAAKLAEVKRKREEERTVPSIERVDAAIAAIDAANSDIRAGFALKELAKLAVVPERLDTVMRIARENLKSSNEFTASEAALIGAKWATEEDVAMLQSILNERGQRFRSARKEAAKKLIDLNVTASFPDIVELISDPHMRRDLAALLSSAGEKMEQPVLDTLDKIRDSFALQSLVEVLGEIGTEKSIPALEDFAASRRFRMHGSRALAKVRKRK